MSTTEQVLPEGNVAGRVEVRGIDHVPAAERRGRPFEMFPLWFSANLSYLYIIFGGLFLFWFYALDGEVLDKPLTFIRGVDPWR